MAVGVCSAAEHDAKDAVEKAHEYSPAPESLFRADSDQNQQTEQQERDRSGKHRIGKFHGYSGEVGAVLVPPRVVR